MRRTARSVHLLPFLALVVVAACGRGTSLGSEEAVEILVLDGVERRQAECLVADLDGELELDKITGLDATLDEMDLALLSAASAACAPAIAAGGGVAAGDDEVLDDLLASELEVEVDLEVDRFVADLVRGGLAAEAAACMGAAIESSPDPLTAIDDDRFLAVTLLMCDPGDRG